MTTAIIDKTASAARKNFTPLPGQTVAYFSVESFNDLSEEEKSAFESVINKTETEIKKKSVKTK